MGIKKLSQEATVNALTDDTHVLVTLTVDVDGEEKSVVRRMPFENFYAGVIQAVEIKAKYMELVQDPETFEVYVSYKGVIGDNGIALTFPPVPRSNVASDVESALTKADTAMQPAVYDTLGLQTDIFQYAKGRADSVYDTYVAPLIQEVRAAYEVNDDADTLTFQNLKGAINGALNAAKAYVRARLVEYRAFTITIVNQLPQIGEEMIFYLVPKDNGGYDKWWWITDAHGNGMWDVFGSTTTLVVDALPQVGDEDTDYIIGSGNDYQYYKYINGEWRLIAGANAEVYTTNKTISIFGHGTPGSNNIGADGTKGNYLDINTLRIYHDEGNWGWVVDQPPTFIVNDINNFTLK